MAVLASTILAVSRRLPRGYWPMMKAAVALDPSLKDVPLTIPVAPDTPLRADLSQSVYATIYRQGCIPHQRGLDAVCQKLTHPGDLIFDVGANIGYTSAMFSHLVGPTGKVVAVEPSPAAFRLLQRSLGSVANIALDNRGLSEQAGELTFYVPQSLDIASFSPIPGASQVRVKVAAGDDFTRSHGQPHLIKVDTEGHELEVFQGLAETLAREDRPILIFEALGAAERSASAQAVQRLSSGGYRLYRISTDGRLTELHEEGTSDFVAIPSWADARID